MHAPHIGLDTLARLTSGADLHRTHAEPALGLRSMSLVDGPMGVTPGGIDERHVSLLTPSPALLGATWDREMVRNVAGVLADEAKDRDAQVICGPNLNLPRSSLAGRSFEYFAEDPLLAADLGASWIRGLQENGVGAVAKHLVCNDSETDRQRLNAVVADEVLREVYLLPFEYAAQAGVWAIMAAYNRCNGTHCAEHPMLTAVLRDEWGWDGVVLSDWFGTRDTMASLGAGLDLEMPGPARVFGPPVAEAVRRGHITEQAVRLRVERLLRLADRVGARDGHTAAPEPPGRSLSERAAVLKDAAAAGFVLLRNAAGLLPLTEQPGRRLAVIGPNAASPAYQGGTFARINLGPEVRTPLESITAVFGEEAVTHQVGVPAAPRIPPLAPLSPRAVHQPESRGATVEYFRQGETEPRYREVRDTGLLVWFRELPGIGALADLPEGEGGEVRVSTLLTPTETGVHTFHVSGTGAVEVRVADEPIGSGGSRATSADVMGALIRGEVTTIEHHLRAGTTVRVSFTMRFGAGRAQGMSFGCRGPVPGDLMERAEKAARDADTAVVVVGVTQDSALESADRESLALPAGQDELVRRVCAANPRTVVVVNAPQAVDMPWAQEAAAVLFVGFPGQEFGPALAEVLSGAAEPGGRLPLTLARRDVDHAVRSTVPAPDGDLRYDEGLLIGYRHFDARGITPRFPFGHGLGYTSFSWSDPRLTTGIDGADPVAAFTVDVTNTGGRAGKEVVQLYVSPPDRSGGRPRQELKDFATLHVPAGATRQARLVLGRRAFSRWSASRGCWEVAAGRYEIRAARSSRDPVFSAVVELDGEGRAIGFTSPAPARYPPGDVAETTRLDRI
ncbi:glycoside hydrolase family 3 protein [Streptomyces sp. NPDC048179]|uniref:glycoside hydrolase family 3 protein n=1 Tax=Streptomyces sp. NPDC048179 TaxID=3365506 RepID=UPI0037180623